MAKIIINLPGGLQVERDAPDAPAPKTSGPVVPKFAPDPAPVEKVEKNLLEKAAEVVEEVVKPKRRGRPKKQADAE
jgi:hypothetical protein